MSSRRQDFPIFSNNPQLVYLDSASSSQKPSYVLEKTNEYITQSYANIGRGSYDLAEKSDNLYYKTKEKIGNLIGCKPNEVFFSHNASYCMNMIAQSLATSGYFKKWGEIMLSVAEHHANILVRQKFAQKFELSIKWIGLDSDFQISCLDIVSNLSDKTVLVSLSLCSNVLWVKNQIQWLRKIIWKDCLFIVDASQAVPNYKIDVKELDCDMLVFSAHKFLAYSWLGVGYIKHSFISLLEPLLLWGGIVEEVNMEKHSLKTNIEKFEIGTPNIISIVSLYYALEYRESIWGYSRWEVYEKELIDYTLELCQTVSDKIKCINLQSENRIGIFTFLIKNSSQSMIQLNEELNKKGICTRVGGHCAYPLANYLKITTPSLRTSFYIYTTKQDIEKFFQVLKEFL